jgi:hypothetical protein
MECPSLVRLRRLVREGRSDAPWRVVDVLGRIGLVGYGVVHPWPLARPPTIRSASALTASD